MLAEHCHRPGFKVDSNVPGGPVSVAGVDRQVSDELLERRPGQLVATVSI